VARDYYGLLGVSRGASDSEIKRAYRKLARELHPDINPDEKAQQLFKEISTAYEVLSDPEKRRIVDLGGDPLATAGAGGGLARPDRPGPAGFGLAAADAADPGRLCGRGHPGRDRRHRNAVRSVPGPRYPR